MAELTSTPNEYGEYFVADTNAGTITLYAMKFSEYGITYEMIHVHEWDRDFTVDAEASCTQNGSKSIHCKTCSEVKDVTAIPAKGHLFSDWQIVIAPTCEGKGSEKHICTVCGHEETREIIPSGHAWESDYTVDKEPTCTTEGSKSIHCNNCNSTKDSTVIPLLEHQWGNKTVVKEATKDEDGEKIFTCERCGEECHVVIPKTGDVHKRIIHWVMLALLALFIIVFVVFTLKKKKRSAFITCGVFGAATIVLAFFGGCSICTVLSGTNLVVIAAGAIFTAFKNKPPGGIDS